MMDPINLPERFLRHIWQHQQFNAENLKTPDGKPVRILFPGTPNVDGGPDFSSARIRVGSTLYRGDVEIHVDAAQWQAHRHDTDPHYNKVILHVVLTSASGDLPATTASRRPIPVLVLHPYIDPTLRSTWIESPPEDHPLACALPCRGLNDHVERDVIRSWLERLGNERLELKVRRFEARLLELIDESKMVAREPFPRYYGSPDEIPPPEKTYTRKDFAVAALWEQLLYEAVMEGFGYAKNNAAFLALAQSARLAILRQNNLEDRHMMQAMLFGAAGLLPVPRTVRDLEARKHVRELRRTWKSRRITFPGPLLHPAEWLFFRLRPANFPTARIAAMSHILPHLFGKGALQEIVAAFGKGSGRIPEHLLERFRFEPEEFWRHRCHFTRRNTSLGIQIGPARIHEILVNGVIPVLLLYARVFKDHELRRNALSVLSNMHSSQSNSVTRVMKEQLLKSRLSLKGALEEQGAIQLFKFYCQRDGCAECEIGRRVFQPET